MCGGGGVPGQPREVECVVGVAGNTPFSLPQLSPRGNLQGWSYKKPPRLPAAGTAGQGGGHRRRRGGGVCPGWVTGARGVRQGPSAGGGGGGAGRQRRGRVLGGRRRRGRCAPGRPLRDGGRGAGAPLASGPAPAGARCRVPLGGARCPPLPAGSSRPLVAEAPGAVRPSRAGGDPAAARGSSAAAPGPTRGTGRPSAPRARTAPARPPGGARFSTAGADSAAAAP